MQAVLLAAAPKKLPELERVERTVTEVCNFRIGYDLIAHRVDTGFIVITL